MHHSLLHQCLHMCMHLYTVGANVVLLYGSWKVFERVYKFEPSRALSIGFQSM
jgi:hypothetical protein